MRRLYGGMPGVAAGAQREAAAATRRIGRAQREAAAATRRIGRAQREAAAATRRISAAAATRRRSHRRAPPCPLPPLWMDQLDLNLFDAWHRVKRELVKNPREAAKRRKGSLRPTFTRPLRSWSLTLRADDKRIAAGAVVRYMRWPGTPDGPLCAVEAVTLTADDVRRLFRPIVIPWPGVSIDEAARQCGVNRATIHQWAKRGRVVMDYYACNPASARRANPNHRLAAKRVWTRRPIDPSGDVICGPWGQMRQALSDRISRDWEQTLLRSHRPTTPGAYIRFFACPRCQRWMKNVYWPMPVWTIAQALGLPIKESRMPSAALWLTGFICRHCAGLIYESVERRSRPSPGQHVDVWDRFVQRISGGMLRGREVARPQSAM